MSEGAERFLPGALLERATARGAEPAWRITDIPEVIEAARLANLISVGGQLQFRIPNGGTCECNWVEVDTYRSVRSDLPWADRVAATATAALSQFRELEAECDFLSEGKKAFAQQLASLEADGIDPSEAMCFVWYLKAERDSVCEKQA